MAHTYVLTGGEAIPLIKTNALFTLDIDLLGGSSEKNVSATTWHVRLGHINAADQGKLRNKGVDVSYTGRAPAAFRTFLANKSAHINQETKKLPQGQPAVSEGVYTDI